MSDDVTCTLTLEDTRRVTYQDNLTFTRIEGEVDQDRLRRDTREWFVDWVAHKDRMCERHEVQLLGRHLYETLFRDKIREEFEKRIDYVRHHADRLLRLQLIFHENAKELARLPWEFLYLDRGAGDEQFLTGEIEQFVLTRFVPPVPDPTTLPPPLDRPAKVLLAACTEESFEAQEIKGLVGLLEARAEIRADGSHPDVDVHKLPNPTYATLKDAVQGVVRNPDGTLDEAADPWKPDVVHVIGHGEPGALLLRRHDEAIDDDQTLALNTGLLSRAPAPPVKKDEPVEAITLRGLFGPHHPPFVFLQTCYSDAIDGVALYTTAQRIVQAGVPAVIAMQYDIERGPADKFACRVYEQLLDGKRIDAAVSAGRILLRDSAGASSPYRAFGTPVVYVGHDGPLVKERPRVRSKPVKANPEPDQREVEIQECPRCHQMCRYQACPTCALRFKCQNQNCERDLEDPLGLICGNCLTDIRQPPWTPRKGGTGNGEPVKATPDRTGPALNSPVSPAEKLRGRLEPVTPHERQS